MSVRHFIIDSSAASPNQEVQDSIIKLRTEVPTLENEKMVPFILLQDGKSKAYYIECHIKAEHAIPLSDLDAALDPDEQEDFRLQRKLQPTHKAFISMLSDASENRQFSDIIVEYDSHYRPEKPLKILGGQHRTVAIEEALQKKKNRYHGYKIFFNLSVSQRNDIAQIANTNIAISLDLIDRMQETLRGPELRSFCQNANLLDKKEDFADRKNPEGIITVRLARTFVVNYCEGKKNTGKDTEKELFKPYVCKSGIIDEKYSEIVSKINWNNNKLLEAGIQFSKLHHKQQEMIKKSSEYHGNNEFKNKALSLAVISSWAYVAGLFSSKPDDLKKFYSLPENAKKEDPLLSKIMSESRHPRDEKTYRGLGTRYGDIDRGRITELFLAYTYSNERKITKNIIEAAIATHDMKMSTERAAKARKKANL